MAGRTLRRTPRLGARSDRGVTGSRRCDSAPRSCSWTHGSRQARFRRSPLWRAPASPRHRCVSGGGSCLSLAQYRQGRQADALATVRRARGLLAAELGLDPCTELAELEQAILRQDPSLLSDQVFRVASPECPYFGLPPAGVGDAERYFGREHELAGAVQALERHGVLLVAGSSGVGKSSFVQGRDRCAVHRARHRGRHRDARRASDRCPARCRSPGRRVAAHRRSVRAGIRRGRPGRDPGVLRRAVADGLPRHARRRDPRRPPRRPRRSPRLRRDHPVPPADAHPARAPTGSGP